MEHKNVSLLTDFLNEKKNQWENKKVHVTPVSCLKFEVQFIVKMTLMVSVFTLYDMNSVIAWLTPSSSGCVFKEFEVSVICQLSSLEWYKKYVCNFSI